MAYEKPTVARLGTLAELTRTWDKQWGWGDVIWKVPVPIHRAS